jgi:drug/metabolite transporter (DMT)-like permease
MVARHLLNGTRRARQLHLVSCPPEHVPGHDTKPSDASDRYAFAPASVVAPLGTVALIANCFIAPLMLHEKFRKKDVLAIGLSIIGAVTIVLSSKSENKSVRAFYTLNRKCFLWIAADRTFALQLTPKQFIHAVSQTAFVVYSFVTLGLIV